MSSNLYKNFARLLEKWPADVSKKGRDLGEHIRVGVAVAFRGGSDEPRDREKCQEIYSRLSTIARNRYKEAFYVSGAASASGLTAPECHEAMSNELLEALEEENRTYKEKFVGMFKK